MSDRYPNIEAIAAGCVAGNFREWPMVRPEAKRLLAERDQLLAALKAARDALYNGFEPDNQSRAWHAANNAVAAAERLAGDKTE